MRYQNSWDDLGRGIQDAVEQAIRSQNYQQLNQTIRRTVETAVDMGGEAIRKAQNAAQTVNQTMAVRKLYGPAPGKAGAVSNVFFGSILGGLGVLGTIGALITGQFLAALPAFVMVVAMAAFGGRMVWRGRSTLGMIKRFKAYKRTLGIKTKCELVRLARAVGKDVQFVTEDVQRMIDQGYFLEGHLDYERTMLITSNETYQQFEQARLELERARKKQAEEAVNGPDPRIQEVLDKGSTFIAQIRKCNDEIPGEAVSEKIDRIELVVRRIFDRVKANPEVIPDLKKLMGYYLPMTVKLLNAYADMDAQPIQGETIIKSKQEIEVTLDTLSLAFEKLLDELFQDTALDISSDITVLNTMLAREGLTEDELTRMRKQQNL